MTSSHFSKDLIRPLSQGDSWLQVRGERKTALLYEGRSAATKTKDENYIAICMRSAHSCRNEPKVDAQRG